MGHRHVLLKRHERAGVKWPGLWRERVVNFIGDIFSGESVNGKNMTTEAK
jgi:hypothetical protein